MKIVDKAYQEELLKRLAENSSLKKERQVLKSLFGRPIVWVTQEANTNKILGLNDNPVCLFAKGSHKKKCLRSLKRTLSRAKRSRNIEKFLCPAGSYGFCLPLVQGDALYGFLIFHHLKTAPSNQSLRLFEALSSTVLEKIQKELELSKLYRTIRPRAIALSTVHTIHRLISSSLDLNELLPRIARLTLQVLRANQCVISLVDKKSKHLVPKAVIDLAKSRIRFRISRNIRQIESKVIHTGNILLKKSHLSVPLIDEEAIGVITVLDKITGRAFDNFDREILTALSEQAIGAIKNAQLYKEQEDMLLGTVKSLSTLLKVKSAYSYAHPKAFVDIVLSIAEELKLSEEDLRNLRFAAMLHGAEKVGIPEEILKKPTALSGKELKIVKEYPKKNVRMLSSLVRLKPAIAILLHHHEKFDGTGYPGRLKREKIPLGSRIMAVADSFMAMVSRRPYRSSTSIPDAIREIKKHSSRQFDPQVIEAFSRLTKRKSFKKLLKGIHYG